MLASFCRKTVSMGRRWRRSKGEPEARVARVRGMEEAPPCHAGAGDTQCWCCARMYVIALLFLPCFCFCAPSACLGGSSGRASASVMPWCIHENFTQSGRKVCGPPEACMRTWVTSLMQTFECRTADPTCRCALVSMRAAPQRAGGGAPFSRRRGGEAAAAAILLLQDAPRSSGSHRARVGNEQEGPAGACLEVLSARTVSGATGGGGGGGGGDGRGTS